MIETLKQLTDGIEEIQVLTGWTHSRIASKAGLQVNTLLRIVNGKTSNPTQDVMDKIDSELQRVREVHGEKPE